MLRIFTFAESCLKYKSIQFDYLGEHVNSHLGELKRPDLGRMDYLQYPYRGARTRISMVKQDNKRWHDA